MSFTMDHQFHCYAMDNVISTWVNKGNTFSLIIFTKTLTIAVRHVRWSHHHASSFTPNTQTISDIETK